jgi:putative ABC transport system permease protein
VATPRFRTGLVVSFAVVALLLAAIGLYGVVAYSVAERRQEIGVRIALGARRADVLRLVVGQGLGLAAAGVCVGLLGATLLTRTLSSLLFGVGAFDPPTLAAVSLLLLAVAGTASLLPARRASRIDPLIALRGD